VPLSDVPALLNRLLRLRETVESFT
jgi:hypothetical protein